MTRFHRALFGAVAAAAVVSLPLMSSALAAPKKPAPKKPAPAKPKGGDAAAGLKAFTAEGCASCHKTSTVQGGEIGPDLSKIGAEKKAPEIAAYIKKPKTGSSMPASKAPQKTIDDMTAYLMTQK